MKKDDLEYYKENIIECKNLNDTFIDFVYDYTLEELIAYMDDEMKETIIRLSPSYYKLDDKWYFNGEFQELNDDEIKEVIKSYREDKI